MDRVWTVYRTTNLVNGRFYLGQHKTANPQDDYLGSGTVIRLAIAKYGISSFKKEVLFIFNTSEEADVKEIELIKTELGNPLCYNLTNGGNSGWEWLNRSGIVQRDWELNRESRTKAIKVAVKAKWDDPSHRISHGAANRSTQAKMKQSQGHKRQWSTVTADEREAIGRARSERWKAMPEDRMSEVRKKCAKARLGNPSHSGKRWVNLNGVNKLIPASEFEILLSKGWKQGRIFEWSTAK